MWVAGEAGPGRSSTQNSLHGPGQGCWWCGGKSRPCPQGPQAGRGQDNTTCKSRVEVGTQLGGAGEEVDRPASALRPSPLRCVCVCVLSVPVCVRAPLCRWRPLGMSVGLYAGVYPCLRAHMCECVMVYMCAYTPVCMAVCVRALVCGVGQLY